MAKIIGFILHKNFEKAYAKLSVEMKTAFKERRNLLLIDPQHPLLNNHPLHGKWRDYRSINISGDIRAIYIIEGFIAVFMEIGSHSELYQ